MDEDTQQSISQAVAQVAAEHGVVVVKVELQTDAEGRLTSVVVTTASSAQDAQSFADAVVELSKQEGCSGMLCRVASAWVQELVLSPSAASAAAAALVFVVLLPFSTLTF